MSELILRRTGRSGRPSERGAATVEAALVICMLLLPLLLGTIGYGNYFWRSQQVGPMSTGLPLDELVGTYPCSQLVGDLTDTVLRNLPEPYGTGIDDDGDLDANDITVEVVRALSPIGAEVSVAVELPPADLLNGLVPLPNGGALVSESTYRLQNVVTTGSCRG